MYFAPLIVTVNLGGGVIQLDRWLIQERPKKDVCVFLQFATIPYKDGDWGLLGEPVGQQAVLSHRRQREAEQVEKKQAFVEQCNHYAYS